LDNKVFDIIDARCNHGVQAMLMFKKRGGTYCSHCYSVGYGSFI